MKSEIQLAFDKCKKEKRPALITYTVASDPNKKKSLEILKQLQKIRIFRKLVFLTRHQLVMVEQFKPALIEPLKMVLK